ncbi:MAG: hypothetical protein KGN84_10045, partial [Acidobacteriota bacterium]|nr:hypothetical protein [Acidobacteriota bacterium]
MKKYIILAAAGLQAFAAFGQPASFQIFTGNGAGGPGTVKFMMTDVMFGAPVVGKPFSGVEVRHSQQVLADGTRIETKSSDRIFRDVQGRTRIEREDGTVLITDPVQGATAEIGANGNVTRHGTLNFTTSDDGGPKKQKLDAEMRARTLPMPPGAATSGPVTIQATVADAKAALPGEDLGYQSVNGVTAKGTRNTTTIEAGKIGNDRPIIIVSERWYSTDLEMMVKSTNSDPRFGDT